MQLTLQFTLGLKGSELLLVYRLNSGAALRQCILFLLILVLLLLDDLLSAELCMDLRGIVCRALYLTCRVYGLFHKMILQGIVLLRLEVLDGDLEVGRCVYLVRALLMSGFES